MALTLMGGVGLSAGACKQTQPQSGAALKTADGQLPIPGTLPGGYSQYFASHAYKREAPKGGSYDAEQTEFQGIQRDITKIQQLNQQQSGAPLTRGFHAKSHGCVAGAFRIKPDTAYDPFTNTRVQRDARTRKGIFASPKSCYNVIVRFSNGVGQPKPDRLPDVRGMAVKFFGTQFDENGQPDTTQTRTMDLLMTNGPLPFGHDTREFADFGLAQVSGTGPFVSFLKDKRNDKARDGRSLTRIILSSVIPRVDDVAQTRFWGGHPYLMGKDKAAKFNVVPFKLVTNEWDGDEMNDATIDDAGESMLHDVGARLAGLRQKVRRSIRHALGKAASLKDALVDDTNPDYLRANLNETVQSGGARFVLMAQFDAETDATPIEDQLAEWPESGASQSTPIGTFDLFRTLQDTECDRLSFTPGRFVDAHRPLGNMGRGRIFAYEQSVKNRHDASLKGQNAGTAPQAFVDPDEDAAPWGGAKPCDMQREDPDPL